MEIVLKFLGSKLDWFRVSTELEMCQASFHITNGLFYLFASLFAARVWSRWFLLSAVPYAGYSIYKELIQDGHLKRKRDGTETQAQWNDMKTDLLTKLWCLPFWLLGLIR